MKWKALYNDLRTVLMKHFRPPAPEKESSEVLLLRHIVSLQKQQRDLTKLRDNMAPLVQLLKNDELFQELDRLAAMAPAPDAPDLKRTNEDIMFI